MIKKIADQVGAVTKIAGVAFTVVTVGFWYGVTAGSWRNPSNGCIEFDLRPTIEGILYSPDPSVITKYENGFTLFNWASFRFYTERGERRKEGGIATGWINPFFGTMSLNYKIQTESGNLRSGGHRENAGLVFERSSEKCP